MRRRRRRRRRRSTKTSVIRDRTRAPICRECRSTLFLCDLPCRRRSRLSSSTLILRRNPIKLYTLSEIMICDTIRRRPLIIRLVFWPWPPVARVEITLKLNVQFIVCHFHEANRLVYDIHKRKCCARLMQDRFWAKTDLEYIGDEREWPFCSQSFPLVKVSSRVAQPPAPVWAPAVNENMVLSTLKVFLYIKRVKFPTLSLPLSPEPPSPACPDHFNHWSLPFTMVYSHSHSYSQVQLWANSSFPSYCHYLIPFPLTPSPAFLYT